jgi:hypothetical protein
MKPKNLPRLWCALQGLLPFEACVAAQRAELAWPDVPANAPPLAAEKPRHGKRARRDTPRTNRGS